MIKTALINSDKDIHVCGSCQNIYDDINKFLNHKLGCPLNKKVPSATEISVDQRSLLRNNKESEVEIASSGAENNYLLQFDGRAFKDQFEDDFTSKESVVKGESRRKQTINNLRVNSNSNCTRSKKKQICEAPTERLDTGHQNQRNRVKKLKQDSLKKRREKPRTECVTKTKEINCCDVCGFCATYRRDLVRHMRKHTGEKPFTCRYCDKKFTRKDKHVSHEQIHLGIKPFKCGKCEYAGSDSGALRLHQLTHTGERRHRCQLCPYKARSASHLVVHLRTHTGDSPYFCSLDSCGSSFKTSSDLNRHMKIHKLDVYSSFKDKSQGYAFMYNSEEVLKNVKSCHVCQDFINTSPFKKRSRKQRHAQCVRSHECPDCGASFVRQDSLRCHIKLHSAPSSSLVEEDDNNDNDNTIINSQDEVLQDLNEAYSSDDELLMPLETLMKCAIDTSAL